MVTFCWQRHSIGTTSVQYAHWFLKEMSDEVNQVITAICEEQCMLNYKVFFLPLEFRKQIDKLVYAVVNSLIWRSFDFYNTSIYMDMYMTKALKYSIFFFFNSRRAEF